MRDFVFTTQLMLSKINRLRRKRDFGIVFKKGKRTKGDCLFLQVAANRLGYNRQGFVISKDVSKKAVVRNRLRRRLKTLAELSSDNGFDMVFVAQSGLERKSFADLKKIVEQLLKKAV